MQNEHINKTLNNNKRIQIIGSKNYKYDEESDILCVSGH